MKRLMHKTKQHQFYFEASDIPWRGPQSKARQALSGVKILPISPEEFCFYLQKNHNKIYTAISYIQFYKYENLEKQKYSEINEFRIAVCFLMPLPLIRDELYQFRNDITKKTGWYPLVMGNKAKLNLPKHRFFQHDKPTNELLALFDVGRLLNIASAASGINGNSFVLKGSYKSILLDTGFGNESVPTDGISGIFLSHFHADHSGGIDQFLNKNIPIFMSESTFRYLYDKSTNSDFRRNLIWQTVIIERIIREIPKESKIKFFQVFHTPGAYGIMVKDEQNNCIWYPGDLCLQNGFLNGAERINDLIKLEQASKNWVLVDATMAHKNIVSISSDDSPEHVLREIIEESNKRNIIICSDSIETMMYAYIYVFVKTRSVGESKAKRLFVNDGLLNLAQSLLGPMIRRNKSQIDPFIKSVIGMNLTNFIESHRVYPLDTIQLLPENEKTIIFLTPSDIMHQNLGSRILGSSVILAGKLATDSTRVPNEISSNSPRTIMRVSSPDWIFHSSESDLVRFIEGLAKIDSHSLLFHNWEGNLNKFIKRNTLDRRLISIIKSEGIKLD